MSNNKYFIVTAHGWSASNWIAHSLNLNKDILCTHSARNVLAADKDLQSNSSLKENINQLQSGYLKRQQQSLDELYSEIEKNGVAPVYGSVHVLRLRDIPIVIEKFGSPTREFKLVNVVRDPMDLVWSGFGQFKDLFRYDVNELHWTSGKVVRQALEFINDLGKRYNLYMGDMENLAFVGACAVLESLKFDVQASKKMGGIQNLEFNGFHKMEHLTSSGSHFQEFMTGLGLSDFTTSAYIEDVFKTGVINKHRHDKVKMTPKQRFDELQDWQKEAFLYFMNLHDLEPAYREMGYELEYMN